MNDISPSLKVVLLLLWLLVPAGVQAEADRVNQHAKDAELAKKILPGVGRAPQRRVQRGLGAGPG